MGEHIASEETLTNSKEGELEHWVVSHVSRAIPEPIRNRWNEYRSALKEAKQEQSQGGPEVEISGWGVEEAEKRNKSEASMLFPP